MINRDQNAAADLESVEISPKNDNPLQGEIKENKYVNNVYQIFEKNQQTPVPAQSDGVLDSLDRALHTSTQNTLRAINEPEKRTQCQKIFRELLIEWRKYHYLALSPTTKMLYDKKIRFFKPLENLEVKILTAREIDQLIGIWSEEAKRDKKRSGRQHFHQELSILRGILNYYKRRMNPGFENPVLTEHFKASVIRQGVKRENQCLTPQELKAFFEALKKHCQRKTYYLAVTQFSLGLRVGEAVALKWEKLDLKRRLAHYCPV